MNEGTHTQNGGQPPLPKQPPPPLENTQPKQASEEEVEVCRKFLWGTCFKYSRCRFRHELVFEEMTKILKFCHDHQNNGVCTRKNCGYLHTTAEEETCFYNTGKLPKVLAERHATIAARDPAQNMASYLPPLLLPPPPPPPGPPPTPAPVAPVTPVTQTAVYPGQSYVNISTLPTAATPPEFDASKPPPPIPHQGLKRKSSTSYEAGSAKTAKGGSQLCDECIRRDQRISSIKKEIHNMLSEEADRMLVLKRRETELAERKALVLSMVNPEHTRAIEDFIDGVSAQKEQASNSPGTNIAGGIISKKIFLLLCELLLNNSSRHESTPVVDNAVDESDLLQNLATLLSSTGAVQPSRVENSMIPQNIRTMAHSNNNATSTAQAAHNVGGLSNNFAAARSRPELGGSSNGYAKPTAAHYPPYQAVAPRPPPAAPRPAYAYHQYADYPVAGPSSYALAPRTTGDEVGNHAMMQGSLHDARELALRLRRLVSSCTG